MDGNFGETSDRGGSTEHVVVVPELVDGGVVGLTRPHSVPLVKIVTSTQQQQQSPLGDVIKTTQQSLLSDVIKSTHSVPLVKIVTSTQQSPLSDVIKTPLNQVLKTSIGDVIKTELGDVIKPLNNVTKGPLGDVIKAPLNIKPLNDVIKPLSDVIKPINDVVKPLNVKPPLSDVIKPSHIDVKTASNDEIKRPLNDVIKTSINVIKTPINDAIKAPLNTNQLSDVSVPSKDEHLPSCSTASSSNGSSVSVTTTITSTPIEDGKVVPAFPIEQDWREAAQDAKLIVRCKKTTGELVKDRFGSGSRGKCIRLGKEWYTPTEFEAHCGRSASKDWKRSIRFQGQGLQTLIEEGFLQVHAMSCSCGICLEDDDAAGAVRLHRPCKRKRRDKIILSTDITTKVLKRTVSEESGSTTPTVTIPVSDLGELTVVPGLVFSSGTSATQGAMAAAAPSPQAAPVSSTNCTSPGALTNLPLDKAWERMNEVLIGLERSVSGARALLNELKARTQQEAYDVREKLINEKEEAVTQAKLEAQLSSMAKSTEGFLVQVRDDDGSQSLQPIMLDSLISSVPTLNPTPPINGVRKKCVNCNRESELECSGCHNKAYCSDFCQRRDWMNHQSECTRSSPPPEDPLNVDSVAQVPGYIFMLSD